MNTDSIRLFVATHKNTLLPENNPQFVALGLGGFRPASPLISVQSDDTGDSIHQKNRNYSELTGWYWIWKNVHDTDVIGLNHYRRYFCENKSVRAMSASKVYVQPTPANLAQIASPQTVPFIRSALAIADVIVPRRQNLGLSIAEQYIATHRREDWDLFLQGIHENCPDLTKSIAWFDLSTELHMYNMMIAPKSFFDSYMSRLFAVLTWMEKQRPFPSEEYQCRVPAFVAERFFSLYLFATQAKCIELPVAILDKAAF